MRTRAEPASTDNGNAVRMVEEYSQNSQTRSGTPTILRIIRSSEQRNWQTYRNDSF